MARKGDVLKLGKGSSFVKSRLKRLPHEDETWEVDFRALPKPLSQNATHYAGMVVTQLDGFILADLEVESRPTVNDLANLLAEAMRRPLVNSGHRPTRILLRGHRQWQELIPHLKEIGIEVVLQSELPQIEEAYKEILRQIRAIRRAKMIEPTAQQAAVEEMFPAIAKWVQGYGYIEIGEQETFGFVTRALGYGGLDVEDTKAETLAEAMAALEKALAAWFEENK